MNDVSAERTRLDLHQRVTDEIVQAIEAGAGKFFMPWHGIPEGIPRNVLTGTPYHGVNTLILWAAAKNRKYRTPYWATYRQWLEVGAQVRKGEKATVVVFYKQIPLEAEDVETGDIVSDYRLVARAFFVFNGAQVEGWKVPGLESVDWIQNHDRIEEFVLCTGADIRSAGDKACYDRLGDYILVPDRVMFQGSPTRSATEGYYSTVFHELVHWTGHHRRLARNLSGRFGDEAYAMEELVAELGAAFLCAEFLVPNKPRQDHAAYIADWLKVLKCDKRAIFSASVAAHQAVDFLCSY
ncbi:MAG: DUF1738 domain-containing protein [Enhydrobacter sp.]|nr:MAG: DUF1738 domain-containing protein [Enhydrobacter sp.]